MPLATTVNWGNGLNVTDLGSGEITVDADLVPGTNRYSHFYLNSDQGIGGFETLQINTQSYHEDAAIQAYSSNNEDIIFLGITGTFEIVLTVKIEAFDATSGPYIIGAAIIDRSGSAYLATHWDYVNGVNLTDNDNFWTVSVTAIYRTTVIDRRICCEAVTQKPSDFSNPGVSAKANSTNVFIRQVA